jgi:hypothetical protein
VVHVHVEHPLNAPVVRFAGHLREHGHEVPAGALVEARRGGELLASMQTQDAGLYALDLCLAAHCGVAGTPLAFTVNGRPAEQSAVLPESAGTIVLDLNVAGVGHRSPHPPRAGEERGGTVRGEAI